MSSGMMDIPNADDIKLIMTDVDGTVLTDQHQVHPRTRDAIKYLRQTKPEIPIIVTTDDCPAASCHGAVIHAPGGKVIEATSLDPKTAIQIVEECRTFTKTCFLFTRENVLLTHIEKDSPTDWTLVMRDFDPNIIDGRSDDSLDQVRSGKLEIIKATLPMELESVSSTLVTLSQALVNHAVETTLALPFILEVVPRSVNKSVALRRFCHDFGCEPRNVLAFGDGHNDVEMLSAAGAGVAMGNAQQVVFQAAKYRTLTNNEGGVGVFLDQIFRPHHQP